VRTLTVWCPDWPVTAAGFGPNDPVAVLDAGKVVAASWAARDAGVRAGLRRREAESRCTGLMVLTRDLAEEARVFEAVVAAVVTLTPRVEVTRPGLLALDARGPARYFGGEESLCQRVREVAHAAQPGREVPRPAVGVADGRFAAALAARKSLVVPPGHNAEFLASFPVSTFGDVALADLLGRLGVRTLGDFAELPEGAVLARFGPEVGRAHSLARGLDDEVLRGEAPVQEIVASSEFDPPAERAETAAFVARSLAADLVAQLEGHGLACARVRIEAETEHGESLSRLWRGDDALGADAMVERLRWQLDGWLSGTIAEATPTAGIARLILAADEVIAVGGRQLGLWGGASDTDRRAARGLDRLRGMLGPDAVFTATLTGGRSPADCVVLVPWGEPPPTPASSGLPWPGHHPLPAPALVHPSPVPIEVTDADGKAVTVSARGRLSATPANVSIDGTPPVAVIDWAGPWTADERWWDPRARRRRARLQILNEGPRAHLCLVEDGRWRIEATYD
jgi:protein ImuB